MNAKALIASRKIKEAGWRRPGAWEKLSFYHAPLYIIPQGRPKGGPPPRICKGGCKWLKKESII